MNAKHIFIGTVVLMLLFSFGCLSSSSTTTHPAHKQAVHQITVKKTGQNQSSKSVNASAKTSVNKTKIKQREKKHSQISSSLINTSGWRTYADPTYDYSIKYPKNWSLDVHPLGKNGTIEIRSPRVHYNWTMVEFSCAKNESMNSVMPLVIRMKKMAARFYQTTPSLINLAVNGKNVTVMLIHVPPHDTASKKSTEIEQYFFWNNKTHVYCIAMIGVLSSPTPHMRKIDQQIVRTFQFNS